MRKARVLVVCALLGLSVAVPQAAWADIPHTAKGPEMNNCFGLVSGQRASTLHDTGEHASSFPEPRTGIGNLTMRVLGFDSVGEAGAALAAIDDIEATSCQ
ncbi:MAG: hypothetical protein M3317_08230 [Actinomycetota bacterium]|nr:hypothetical protein [Actinomycetota bacterium]